MKKEIIIFLLMLITLISFPFVNSSESNYTNIITGSTITGEVTNVNLGVSITVQIGEPNLTIINPKNQTYINSQNLPLNFISENTQIIWYNIDYGTNITVTGNTTFNTSSGAQTLYLYANNSDGNETVKNVTFTVNLTKFIIYYDVWTGSTQGDTTNFNSSTYEDLQNLSGIILENINYGKIQFNNLINLTNDSIIDSILDLNRTLNISSNKIELNSSTLPNFNVNASLWLYNLNFTNPRILKNGVVCPDTVCVIESYSEGTIKFNITGFSNYTVEEFITEETPSNIINDGGGGSGSLRETEALSVEPQTIFIKLKQGEIKEEIIEIKNTGNKETKVILESLNLENLLELSENSFNLEPGKSKIIYLDVLARENLIPDLYIGKILIKGEETEKEILITVEIESKQALMDVELEIFEEYKSIYPGEKIIVKSELYNLGERKRADILLEYIIKNEDNEVILEEKETIAVETKTEFIKEFEIPLESDVGKYFIYLRAIYNGKVASSSRSFEVIKERLSSKDKIYIGVILLLIILIAILISLYIGLRKTKREKQIPQIGIDEIVR